MTTGLGAGGLGSQPLGGDYPPPRTHTAWRIDSVDIGPLVDQPAPTLTRGDEIELQFWVDVHRHYRYFKREYGWINSEVITVESTDSGIPYITGNIDPEDIVVSIKPLEDIPSHEPFWGAVIDLEDESTVTGGNQEFRRLDLEVVVLAELDEYEDKEDVVEAFL